MFRRLVFLFRTNPKRPGVIAFCNDIGRIQLHGFRPGFQRFVISVLGGQHISEVVSSMSITGITGQCHSQYINLFDAMREYKSGITLHT